MKNVVLVILLVAIITSAGGFYAGMKYQQSKNPRFTQFQQRTGSNTNFRPINGEITSIDTDSLTVKTTDGSKIIIYSATTKINKTSEGSAADLKTGEQVMIIGSTSSDGTITAQNISVGGRILPPRN